MLNSKGSGSTILLLVIGVVILLIVTGILPLQFQLPQQTVGGVTAEGDFDATPSIVNHFTPSTTYMSVQRLRSSTMHNRLATST